MVRHHLKRHGGPEYSVIQAAGSGSLQGYPGRACPGLIIRRGPVGPVELSCLSCLHNA